ncbi:hypothetical protein GCM10009782_34830 [Glycomyces algeriensis]
MRSHSPGLAADGGSRLSAQEGEGGTVELAAEAAPCGSALVAFGDLGHDLVGEAVRVAEAQAPRQIQPEHVPLVLPQLPEALLALGEVALVEVPGWVGRVHRGLPCSVDVDFEACDIYYISN